MEGVHLVLEGNRAAQAAFLDEWRQRLTNREADGRSFLVAAIDMSVRQHTAPGNLLGTFIALSQEDDAVAELNRCYDESDQRELARFLRAVTTRERVPSPLAAARLVDITVAEVATRVATKGSPSRDLRVALLDMLDRYLFGPAGSRGSE